MCFPTVFCILTGLFRAKCGYFVFYCIFVLFGVVFVFLCYCFCVFVLFVFLCFFQCFLSFPSFSSFLFIVCCFFFSFSVFRFFVFVVCTQVKSYTSPARCESCKSIVRLNVLMRTIQYTRYSALLFVFCFLTYSYRAKAPPVYRREFFAQKRP